MTEARDITKPEPGFFRMRLVTGGPWVPAHIFTATPADENGHALPNAAPIWHAMINDELVRDPSVDPFAAGVFEIWESGAERIDATEYGKMVTLKEWAEEHAPDAPEANPRRPVDLAQMSPAVDPTGPRHRPLATPEELGFPDPPMVENPRERVDTAYAHFRQRTAEFDASFAEHVPDTITTKKDAKRVSQFITQLAALKRTIEARADIERAGHIRALQQINASFDKSLVPLDKMRRECIARLKAFNIKLAEDKVDRLDVAANRAAATYASDPTRANLDAYNKASNDLHTANHELSLIRGS